MKKQIILNNEVGSAEMVVAHAKWQHSRGRNPSMSFVGQRNPRRALAFAISVIKSYKWIKLADSIVPAIINHRSYHEMSDLEVEIAAKYIIRDSSSEEEIRTRLSEELGYSDDIDMSISIPEDATGREARELLKALGGLIMKNGAMVNGMMHGHEGIIFL
jgi:hypothetical protein